LEEEPESPVSEGDSISELSQTSLGLGRDDPAPLPDSGMQYIVRESSSPLMEVWKARAADGRPRQVKIIKGLSQKRSLTDKELERIASLKTLKHPRLVPIEEIQLDAGRVVIVTNVPDSTLADRHRQLVAKGHPGIEHKELLQYLAIVAEGLDYLFKTANLFHLYLNPGSLCYYGGMLRLADYSIAQLAWLPAGQKLDARGLRYAAPELFDGKYHPNSDQFSLALIYAEMLTGQLPFRGTTVKMWREMRRDEAPDLRLLPTDEQETLRRALNFEPVRRYPSTADFLDSLIRSHAARVATSGMSPKQAKDQASGGGAVLLAGQPVPVVPQDEVEAVVRRLLQVVAARTIYNSDQGIRFQVEPDGSIVHRCAAWVPGGLALNKLDGFVSEWKATLSSVSDDRQTYVYHLPAQQSFWRKMLGLKQNYIEIEVSLVPPNQPHVKQTEVEVRLRYTDAKPGAERERLEVVAPALIFSLRTYLLAKSEARYNERYRYEVPVYLYPVYVNCVGDPIPCRTKDISVNGVGILSDETPDSRDCIVQMQTDEFGTLILPGRIIRDNCLSGGKYDLGIRFF
jgi:hypothetical protein